MSTPVDLERLIDRELRRMPAPLAPKTLIPRVLGEIERWSRRPWYERAWMTWPVAWQAASLAACVAVVAGLLLLGPALQREITNTVLAVASDAHQRAGPAIDAVLTAITTVRVVWRALIEPVAPYLFALTLLISLACGLFAAALSQITSGRMVER